MTNRTVRPYECAHCGETFWTWKYHQKFCSRSCRTKSLWSNDREKMLKGVALANKVSRNLVPWNKGLPWSEEVKEKLRASKSKDTFMQVRGGNGNGMTKHEAMLATVLTGDWRHEYAISLGGRIPGYPTCYKVDFAWPEQKICLEVDGSSHSSLKAKARDAKKTEMLASLGWLVLRITNQQVAQAFST
jgi:very-short-patch-repair endonuclease